MIRYKGMNRFINSQVESWRRRKEQINDVEKIEPVPFVTISREYGSGGYDIAEKLIEIINDEYKPDPAWAAFDRKMLDSLMEDTGLSSSLIETFTNSARNKMTNLIQTTFSKFPPQVAIYKKLVEIVRILALNGNVVIVGRAGNVITRDMKYGYHVRIVASPEWKAERISGIMNISTNEAQKVIVEKTKDRDNFIKEFVKFDVTDPHNYHVFINNSKHSTEEVARTIIEGLKIKGLLSI